MRKFLTILLVSCAYACYDHGYSHAQAYSESISRAHKSAETLQGIYREMLVILQTDPDNTELRIKVTDLRGELFSATRRLKDAKALFTQLSDRVARVYRSRGDAVCVAAVERLVVSTLLGFRK